VRCRDDVQGDVVVHHRVADIDLGDVREPGLHEQAARAAWRDHAGGRPEPLEGGNVQVVEVHVRQQDDVDVVQRGVGDGAPAAEMGDPGGEQRIGHDPVTTDVDHGGGVPGPGDVHDPMVRTVGPRPSAAPVRLAWAGCSTGRAHRVVAWLPSTP